MARLRWDDGEWSFCLYCFYNNKTIEEAYQVFSQNYNRTLCSIKHKFTRKGISINDFTGSGLGAGKITKSNLIKDLKAVYEAVTEPFSQEEYEHFGKYSSATQIGYFGSWESAIAESGLKKKFDLHKKVETEIAQFDPEKELNKDWHKQKSRLLEKAEQRRVKYLKQEAHKLDIVRDMIDEAVAKAEPLIVNRQPTPRTKNVQNKKDQCTLWFEFSDLQLGTLIDDKMMGGLNSHNWVIWQKKLKIWKEEVLKKIAFYRDHFRVDRIVIACLGDMVEGQDIFRGQVWHIDRNVIDQAIDGANDTAAVFAEIMLAYDDMHFDILEVFGNHGRIGRKQESPYQCSMDRVYQRMLESQLKGIPELTNYVYHRNECWFYFTEIYGWNHLLLHGDQGMSKLWSSRPTVNGLEKGIVRYNQMLQSQVHFVHAGHFHNDWQLSFNLSQMLINGSFIGTSNFSATVMVASSPPVQVMHVFEPRTGLAKTERIYLLDGPVKKTIQPKSL